MEWVLVASLVLGLVAASTKDYYAILGVPKSAGSKEVKKAFRQLALKFHPDKNSDPDAESKFRDIAEGWLFISIRAGLPQRPIRPREWRSEGEGRGGLEESRDELSPSAPHSMACGQSIVGGASGELRVSMKKYAFG